MTRKLNRDPGLDMKALREMMKHDPATCEHEWASEANTFCVKCGIDPGGLPPVNPESAWAAHVWLEKYGRKA